MSARIAALILALGTAYFLLSGRAEDFGMAALRGLLLLLLLPSPLLLVYVLLAPLFRLRWPSARGAWLLGGAIVISWGLVLVGLAIDDERVAQTMERGEELVRLIEAYRKQTGALPESLEVLAENAKDFPEPALAGSSFNYSRGEDGDYRLGFPSVAFLYCNYRHETGKWYCDD